MPLYESSIIIESLKTLPGKAEKGRAQGSGEGKRDNHRLNGDASAALPC